MSDPKVTIRVAQRGAKQTAAEVERVAEAQRDVARQSEAAARALERQAAAASRSTTAAKTAAAANEAIDRSATKATSSIGDLSESLDKGLENSIGRAFKATDRLTSIVGQVTGAIGLATLAVSAGVAAYKALTGASKAVGAGHGQMTLYLNSAKDAFDRGAKAADGMRKAEERLAAAIGVRLILLDPSVRAQAQANEQTVKNATTAIGAIRSTIGAQKAQRADLLKTIATQEKALQQAARAGNVVASQVQARADALTASRAQLDALDQSIAQNELLVGSQQAAIRTADAWTKGIIEQTKAAEGLNAATKPAKLPAPPKPPKLPTPPKPEQSLAQFVEGLDRGALNPLGDMFGESSPLSELLGESGTGGPLTALMEQTNAAGAAFGEMGKAAAAGIGQAIDASEQQRKSAAAMTESITASAQSYASAALSAALYGGSVSEAINATARAAFVEGTVGALGALAKAAVFSIINPPGVAPMLAAAKMYAAQAAVAGAIAAGTGGITGGGGGGGGAGSTAITEPTPADFGEPEQRERQDSEMYINFASGQSGRPVSRADAGAIVGALVDLARSGGYRLEARRA